MNIPPRPDQELKIQEALRPCLIKHEADLIDISLGFLYDKKQLQAEAAGNFRQGIAKRGS